MHVVFIPYGKRSEVELMLRDMEAQKHQWPMWKPNGEKQFIWTQGGLRIAPFGIYEYTMPKEDLDAVLTTLRFDNMGKNYTSQGKLNYFDLIGKARLTILRKLAGCMKAPEYDKTKKYLWINENVKIIPLGIREDSEHTDTDGQFAGWTHETL